MSDDLCSKFTYAGDSENEVQLGQQSGSMDGLIERGPTSNPAGKFAKSCSSRKDKRDVAQYLELVDQMQEQLDKTHARMEETYGRLEEKYGEDVISGMAATYLDEGVLADADTDKAKLRALADKLLNANGQIKPEYMHLDDAIYVRDWNATQTLAPIVEKYQGRDTLTSEEEREIIEAAAKAGLVENVSVVTSSNNSEHKSVVDSQLEANRTATEQITTDTGFKFD